MSKHGRLQPGARGCTPWILSIKNLPRNFVLFVVRVGSYLLPHNSKIHQICYQLLYYYLHVTEKCRQLCSLGLPPPFAKKSCICTPQRQTA